MEYRLTAKAAVQIAKPLSEVFEAVINPDIMSNYFISKGSALMSAGTELWWVFPEFEGEIPIKVTKVLPNEKIVFLWGNPNELKEVTITFVSFKEDTVVVVAEGNEEITDENLEWVVGNTEGWTSFLLCMKAWLEYGIHLRKGSYQYRFDENFKF